MGEQFRLGERFEAAYGDEDNEEEDLFGEQGDDKIWVGGNVKGDVLVRGGTGDD